MHISQYPLLKEELLNVMLSEGVHSDELNIRKTANLQLVLCQAWRLDNKNCDHSAELLQELDWAELSNEIALALIYKKSAITADTIIKVAQNELILDRIEERLIHQMDAIYDSYKADNK